MLNQIDIDSHWRAIREGIRTFWGKLTDEEINQYKNDLSEIQDLIQKKHGESKMEIAKKLSILLQSFENETDRGLDPDISSYHRSPLDSK